MKWIKTETRQPEPDELVFVFYGNQSATDGGAMLNVWEHACNRIAFDDGKNIWIRKMKADEMPTHWMPAPLHPNEGEYGWISKDESMMPWIDDGRVFIFAFDDGSVFDNSVSCLEEDGEEKSITHWMMLPKAPDELGWKKNSLRVVEDE